ncbi:MAG: galactose-1-phosphate uridylyltransferase [Microthrixaceae bacterium]
MSTRSGELGGPASEARTDPLSGVRSVIVPQRQGRPNLPSAGCPFCPGGLEAPEGDYEPFAFANRWPAMDGQRCEVVLYTDDHDLAFWELGRSGALAVVELWARRTRELLARPDVGYVLVFENRGVEVGATIAHPHGQIYAYEEIPPVPLGEIVDGILVVPPPDDPRVVSTSGTWTAYVPEAPTWPYELTVATATAHGSLGSPGLDTDGLAGVLVDVLARLDQFAEGPMPYMMWIHQLPWEPHTGGPEADGPPVHLHIAAHLRAPGVPRYVAAAELGGGVFFDPVDPLEAARRLRELPGSGGP